MPEMDIKLTLAAVMIAGGVIGMLLPDSGNGRLDRVYEGDSRGFQAARPVPDQRVNVAQQPAASGWAEEVTLEREMDGHFYADVEVDGRNYRMMVDTGASVVALTEQDALAMGLSWFEEDVAPVAQGAGGPVNGVHATIRHMAVGYHEASNVRAIILTEGGGMSLLGQSFLSTLDNVQINDDQMVLSN
jgi:aspartyl protease family protein